MPRRLIAYALYGLLVAAAFGFALARPLAFQKGNTLRPAAGFPELRVSDSGYVDIEAMIRPIPMGNPRGKSVWNVHPETRHRETILEGDGGCSQKVFGLAYALDRQGVDYQIVHMMTPQDVTTGDGHTVLRLPYHYDGVDRVGLVDVSFGVILAGAHGPLDVAEVEDAPVAGWTGIELNPSARFPYYHDEDNFVPESYLGYIPASEVRDYYRFLDRVYFSFGHDLAEKYLFDGLALLVGRLPEVFVPHLDELLSVRRGEVRIARASLFVIRSAVVVLPLILLFEGLRRRRR
jgi:hypothetical protein